MNKNDTLCSRVGVERYLLNRMSPEEETLFQKHLHTCRACNAYLSAARNLA
ncbi:MAG: zf-HC2 domain-containing protein, partial [Tannerella sp.]|nr:zf-HC2 domain-containing protein [Tannerella sp.]